MSKNKRRFKRIETNLVHAGSLEETTAGSLVTPVFQSTVYKHDPSQSYERIRYPRLSTSPNHDVLHQRLAAVESAETAVVAASGMAAITTTILALCKSSDHLLAHNCLYGGTQMFLNHHVPSLAIDHATIDAGDPSTWTAALKPNTRIIYVEAITNPLMEVGELDAVVQFARNHQLVSVIDSTFATPINFRPLEIGFDIAIHSATKYLGGHSDLCAGVVAGSERMVAPVRELLHVLGGSLDPSVCFLLERGLKTLALRVRQQNKNAMELAGFLRSHTNIRQVNYCGLKDNPSYPAADRLFSGFGGMLSFRTDSVDRAKRFLNRVKIAAHSASLGGVETLVIRPATSSHAGLSAEEREKMGITDDLVRVSVGIEAVEELIEDFQQALAG